MTGSRRGATSARTAADSPAGATGRWAPTVFFVGLLIVLAMTSTRGVSSVDDRAPAVEAWHIAATGSPWLEHAVDGLAPNLWLHEVPNGHVVADRMAGPVIISLPFYLLLDRNPASSGFTIVPGGVAAAFFTAATGCLMFLALRRRLGERIGMVAATAFTLATPTWSVSADGPWPHTVTQFGLSGAAYAASRGAWWKAGIFLGVGMWGRPHIALVAAVLGLGMSWTERSLRPAARVALPGLVSLVLLVIWNKWMFGVWSVVSVGYIGHASVVTGGPPAYPQIAGVVGHLVNYAGFFVAPDRGLLIWTPALIVLTPAVLRARRQVPPWSQWLALGGVIYTVLQLQMSAFHGGDNFYGYRNALELLTCLTPVCALSLPWVGGAARRVLPSVLAVQTGAILVGAATPELFVPAARVWRDNSFFMAVRGLPGPMIVLILGCAAAGLLGSRLVARWAVASTEVDCGYRRSPEPVD